MKKLIVVAILLAVGSLLNINYRTEAQSGSGLRISPLLTENTAFAGDQIFQTIRVTNVTNEAGQVSVTFWDFEGGTDGVPTLIQSDEGSEYGMKQWFEPVDDFNIGPSEEKDVELVINIPEDADEKTYFSSVTFNIVTEEGNDYSLTSSVGTLVFVNVGPALVEGQIDSFSADQPYVILDRLSVNLVLGIENLGQYRFTPVISVSITDESGEVVDTITPSDVGSILPNSVREYDINYESEFKLDLESTLYAQAMVLLTDGDLMTSQVTQIYPLDEAAADDQTDQVPIVNEQTGQISSEPDDESSTNLLIYALAGAIFTGFVVFIVVQIKRKNHHAVPGDLSSAQTPPPVQTVADPQSVDPNPIDNDRTPPPAQQ